MTPLGRRFPLQPADRAAVATDHALQLVHVTAFNQVVQHLQHSPRATVERLLRNDLVAATHAVLHQKLFVHAPHSAESGGGVHVREPGVVGAESPKRFGPASLGRQSKITTQIDRPKNAISKTPKTSAAAELPFSAGGLVSPTIAMGDSTRRGAIAHHKECPESCKRREQTARVGITKAKETI